MSLEVKVSCPFGSKCEDAKDGALHRCAMYIELAGKNPNTGEEMKGWYCAMAVTPVLLIENAQQHRSANATLESFRNAAVEGNVRMQQAIHKAIQSNAQHVPVIREIN